MNQLVYLLALAAIEILGDFALEKYANFGGNNFLTLGSLCYVGVVFFLIKSLQGSNILFVNAAWDGWSALIESAAAYIFLGQRFDHPMQYIGLFLIVSGLFFIKTYKA